MSPEYADFRSKPEWPILAHAVQELADNHVVEERDQEKVVAVLCKALAERAMPTDPYDNVTPEERMKAWDELREMVRAANPDNRDLVAELIAERRLEAGRE